MSIHLKIASDFVCPYCYVLEAMIAQVRPEVDVEIEYLPFELTEPPAERVDTYNDPERRARYAKELEPLCEKVGLKMCLPPKVVPRRRIKCPPLVKCPLVIRATATSPVAKRR